MRSLVITMILFSFPAFFGRCTPVTAQNHPDPAGRPDIIPDPLYTFLTDELVVFRLDPEPEHLTLRKWLDEHEEHAVIVFLNRLWPEPFAQLIPFEKLARNHQGRGIRFAVVHLHRKPREFLLYISRTIPSDTICFSVSLTSFSPVLFNYSQPMTIFYHAGQGVMTGKHFYCSYDILQETLKTVYPLSEIVPEGETE